MILKPQGGTHVFTAINLFNIGATAPAVTSSPLRAPILKRLIAFTPPSKKKKKFEPLILRPQGGTHVFTAINLFKIGATAQRLHQAPTGADFEKVDYL